MGAVKHYSTVAVLEQQKYWKEKFFFRNEEKVCYIDRVKTREVDTYGSVNEFSVAERSEATIVKLNHLYCDIDCHNGIFNEWMTLDILRSDFFGSKVPYPSVINNSGRGLHLYWTLENETADSLAKWKALQHLILNNLEEINQHTNCSVDFKCVDPARVLRTPGTFNTLAGTYCRPVEETKLVYTLDDILECFYDVKLEDLKPFGARGNKNTDNSKKTLTDAKKTIEQRGEWFDLKIKRTNGIVSLFNAYSLLTSRAQDFKKLLELRDGDMPRMRDEFLTMYAWTVISKKDDLERVQRELHGINSLFKAPLTDREVDYKAKYIFNKFNKEVVKGADVSQFTEFDRYWYRNTTIINRLDITMEEQRHMLTIISKEEKNRRKCEREKKARRNENGLTKKQQEKADLQMAIIECRLKGMTNKETATTLAIPLKSLERHITALKKEGRL